jgi:hypothetical protein
VTVGFDQAGCPLEVFASGASAGPHREGSEIHAMIADACVALSLALQHGARPEALAKSMLRTPAPGDDPWRPATRPASPVGAIVGLLVEVAGGGDS